jgi:hypothetical protein
MGVLGGIMQKNIALAALVCTGCTFGTITTNSNTTIARQIHSDYLKSDQGFGVDPNRQLFHDSFETGLTQWVAPNANSSGDVWKGDSSHPHYGLYALTYGGNAVISKAVDFNQVALATKDAISLTGAQKPVLILFACFDQQGPSGDETAFKASVSDDLGFNWVPIVPQDATSSVIEAGATPSHDWKRYRYDLSAYKDEAIRLRIDIKASLSNRKLLYIDDVLVAEDR